MKPQSPKEYLAMFDEMAKNNLKNHRITKAGENYWIFRDPANSFYWCQIIVTEDRSVIVHGDVDLVCFQRFCGDPGLTRPIQWVAESSLDYLKGKAVRGIGHSNVYTFDESVALYEAIQRRDQHLKDGTDEEGEIDEYEKKAADKWAEVIEFLEEESPDQRELQEFIYETFEDPEELDIGEVPSARLILAWLIIRKLWDVLKVDMAEKEGQPNE